jgi:outer membrane protein assembly factor BamB
MRAANLVVVSLLLSSWSWLIGADWDEWRGPHRDGTLNAEPKAWPEKLNQKWKITVGEGHSSPILAAGSVYVFARQDGQETVLAVDPANGNVRWKQQYPAPYKMNPAATAHGEGPKSTPLYSRGKLYTLGISGILSSFDAETGKLRWRKEFSHQFKNTSPDFGVAVSPLIDNGLLIVHVGGSGQGALTAFDADSGQVKWSWNGDGPAYASPIVAELGGTRQVVTQTQKNVVAVSAASGQLLWKIPFTTTFDVNIVTPLVYHDTLIFSGLANGIMAVRPVRKGAEWTAEKVWQTKDESMNMSSPVITGDLLFGFSHLQKGQLFCLDPRTGTTLWQGPPRDGDNAALLVSPTALVVLKDDGEMIVARPNGKSLDVIRRYTVADSSTYAHPVVLADGVLVKDVKTLTRWSVQ